MGFSPCFVMQYLVSFLVLYLSILAERERERERERESAGCNQWHHIHKLVCISEMLSNICILPTCVSSCIHCEVFTCIWDCLQALPNNF